MKTSALADNGLNVHQPRGTSLLTSDLIGKPSTKNKMQ